MTEEGGSMRFTLDARQSRFTVRVTAGGPLAKLGHSPTISITDFSGEIQYSPRAIEKTKLSLSIRSSSLQVADDLNEKDRREIQATMLQEVLEEKQFPSISFESSEVSADKVLDGLYRAQIVGTLSLHGVSRRHRFDSQVALVADGLRASGDFSILQTDYGIRLYSVAAGALRLKDELKLTFDVVAKKRGMDDGQR